MSVKTIVKQMLRNRGMVLSRPPGQFDVFDWKLAQLKNRGGELRCVIDGGAHQGDFTHIVLSVFPDVQSIMVEPRDEVQPVLQQIVGEHPKCKVVKALLGPTEQTVKFFNADVRSSLLPNSEGKAFGHVEEAQMTTIDRIVQQHNLPTPDLIKLDLQGAELEALKGASESMKSCAFVMLECSLFPFQKGQPVFADVIAFMAERGYALYDIPSLWHRLLDGALAQGDFLFIRADHPLRKDARWGLENE